jgi:hypothetical protein
MVSTDFPSSLVAGTVFPTERFDGERLASEPMRLNPTDGGTTTTVTFPDGSTLLFERGGTGATLAET